MKFALDDYHRNTPEDILLGDLKLVADKLRKKSVTRYEYEDNGRFSTTTYVRRFGSWFNALERAGLEKTRTPMNIPDEELFHNLEEIWVTLGRQPRYREVLKPVSKYSVGVYEKRYGNWRKALERFVEFINNDGDSHTIEPVEGKVVNLSSHKTTRNINWRLRFVVMKRDNFKCQSCGRSPATDPSVILHVDHKKPWANGGETIFDNLQTLCSVCNIGKSNL